MICRCFGLSFDTRPLGDAARLVLGLPSYAAYLAHFRAAHPDAEPLDEAAFFRARLGSGGFRCC